MKITKMYKIYKKMKMEIPEDQLLNLDHKHKEIKSQQLLRKKN